MKQRLMSGVIYFALLLSILLINNKIVDSIIVTLISLISMHEYMKAFKQAGYSPISIFGYVGCISIFFMGLDIDYYTKMLMIRIFIPIAVILMFVYVVLKKLKVTVIDVALTLLSFVYIPFLFSFVKIILSMTNGRVYIWFVLLGAFASDICGYIFGRAIGKRKLCPDISPKKTVEGAVAGIVGVVVCYVIFGIILNYLNLMQINTVILILMGVVCAIVGQFGDLAASAIKRFCKIKDFGSVMPGHGGILDRCDSILFVAPVAYIFLKVFILI